MLETGARPQLRPGVGGTFVTRRELAVFWKKYARLIVGTILLSVAIAVIYLVATPPSYLGRAQLLIEPIKVPGSGDSVQEIPVDQGQVESQVEVLRSRKLADEVIRRLNLTGDSEFVRQNAPSDPAERMRLASEEFAERLNVRRVGQSYVVEAFFRSRNPDKAAQIINALTDAYLSGGWRFDTRFHHFRRFSEPVEKQALAISNVYVITPATAPTAKSSPQTKLVLALGVLLGGLIGTGCAMALHSWDRTVQSPAQVKGDLGIECLGALPILSRKPVKSDMFGFNAVARAPYSRFSDAMGSVKTAIDFAGLTQDLRSIGILSSVALEGKSTIASNLATLYSLAGARPLLVDFNFRNPTLSHAFAPSAKSGVIELLQGKGAEGIVYDQRLGTHFVPLVGAQRIARALDLLGDGLLKRLLDVLNKSYAPIILDLPSLNAAPDARAICSLLDSNIVVAEWLRTRTEDVRDASGSLEAANAHVLGVVINKFSG